MSKWTPMKKIIAGFVALVIIDGIIVILASATDLLALGGREWVTLLVATFAPLVVAFLKSDPVLEAFRANAGVGAPVAITPANEGLDKDVTPNTPPPA